MKKFVFLALVVLLNPQSISINMKRILTLSFLVIALAMSFSACEKLKSLADVKFDAEFQTDLDVTVTPSLNKAGIDGVFSASATIDPLSDSEFKKYAEKIKKIEITDATAEIITINPSPVQLISAELKATSAGMADAQWNFANETLSAGTKLNLSNANNQWTNLQAILDNKVIFTVSLNGQTDVNDATFKLRVTYKTKITANPL